MRACAGAAAQSSEAQAPNYEDPGRDDEFARRRGSCWARLIKKVYEADPLVCPRCSGPLKIVSLIGDAQVIEKILRHLKLWDPPERPPPRPAGRSMPNDDPIVDFDEPGDGHLRRGAPLCFQGSPLRQGGGLPGSAAGAGRSGTSRTSRSSRSYPNTSTRTSRYPVW